MAPILEVKNLTHIYSAGTPFEHAALKDISFSVEPGEFIGVIGHTGSGKSTLMQHLNGLLKPTGGTVLLGGKDIWSDKQLTRQSRFRVGLVFQYPEYQLFEETVYKDIAFGPKNMGLTQEEIDRRVRESLAFVGMSENCLDKSPFDLSGGQKRRVAIAGVLAMKPKIIVFDEPTAGLDPIGKATIFKAISEYRDKHNAVVIVVSHSMEDIAAVCDKVLVLNDGKLVSFGKTRDVFSESEKLKALGLNVPMITNIFLELKRRYKGIDSNVLTVDEAVKALTPFIEKRRNKNA